MNKRCGLPLELPLHAKKLCPGLSHAAGPGIVSGMGNGKKRGLSCRSTGATGAGISRRCREIPADGKRQKSGHDPDGHVRFFDGSIASAEGPPRTAGLPRLQRRDAAGGTGKGSFRAVCKDMCRFQRKTSLHGPVSGKGGQGGPSARREPPDTGPQAAPVTTKRRGRRCTGDPGHRQRGNAPPVPQSFFRSRFPGCRRPGPRPHRRRDRPWRNGGYGAA